MGWISPTSFQDPDNKWGSIEHPEAHAYDDNTDTYTINEAADRGYYLVLIPDTPIYCNKLRLYTATGVVAIEIYYDGSYHEIYSGAIGIPGWCEKSFNLQYVEKMRIMNNAEANFKLYEFDFWQVEPSAPGYENCVGLWRMNDNAANKTVKDSSGKGHDGTAQQNTDQLHTEGKINGALTFDGTNDYIEIPHHVDFNLTGKLSFVFLVKQTADDVGYILSKTNDDHTAYYYEIRLYNYGAYHYLYFYYGHAGDTTDSEGISLPSRIDDGEYHLVILTIDEPALKYYIDGSYIGEDTLDGDMLSADFPVYIGQRSDGVQRFDGALDVTTVFKDKALSEEEIIYLWNEGKGRENLNIARSLVGGSFAAGKRGLIG